MNTRSTSNMTEQSVGVVNQRGCSDTTCYYVPLGAYSQRTFDVVPTRPPLCKAVVYRDVFYAPPNYQTLTRPIKSENTHYNYPSIHNAYCACQSCNYAVCSKCTQLSNQCANP